MKSINDIPYFNSTTYNYFESVEDIDFVEDSFILEQDIEDELTLFEDS